MEKSKDLRTDDVIAEPSQIGIVVDVTLIDSCVTHNLHRYSRDQYKIMQSQKFN